MIQMIPALPDNVVGFVAKGEITSEDYEKTLIPAVEEALARHDKIRFLYVLGDDFEGASCGAMWEDSKVGMEHLKHWEKMAVVTDRGWIRHTLHAFGYLIPGSLKVFPVAEEAEASAWVTS